VCFGVGYFIGFQEDGVTPFPAFLIPCAVVYLFVYAYYLKYSIQSMVRKYAFMVTCGVTEKEMVSRKEAARTWNFQDDYY